MTAAAQPTPSPVRPIRSSPGALRWVLAAALAGPATIVLHELGHYLAGRLAGRTDLSLHHASVGHRESESAAAALLTGGGLLVSWGLALSCLLKARRRAAPLVVATGLAAVLRSLPAPLFLLAGAVGRLPAETGLDELELAAALGLPPLLGAAAGTLVLAATVATLIGRVPDDERRPALVGLLVGFGVGIPLWLFVVGPVLLP